MTTNTTTPVTATLAAVALTLMHAGFAPHTAVAPYRGVRELHFSIPAPGNGLGPNGVVRVGLRTGKVTSAVLYTLGEIDGRRDVTGARNVHSAIVTDIVEPAVIAAAAARSARGETFNPEEGDLVRYHGSQAAHHGVWRVLGIVEYGEAAGRLCLKNPDDDRESLILSLGSTSISPIT